MGKAIIILKVMLANILIISIWFAGSFFIMTKFAEHGLDEVNLPRYASALSYDEGYDDDDEVKESIWMPELQANAENYLLVGVDSRQGNNANMGAGGSEISGMRSDTIMIAHVSGDRSRITTISIPRDLSVTQPGCQSWDPHTETYGAAMPVEEDVKINSTFAKGGPRCLVKVLTKITGLKFTRYAGVDFAGFESIVDTVGGVPIHSENELIDKELGHIMDAGEHTLSGKEALNYVRARKIIGETGSDYARMHRQQMFLAALIKKLTSSNTLTNPHKMIELSKEFINTSFGENITLDHISEMAEMLVGMNKENIVFMTLPTTGSNSKWNEVQDTNGINNMMQSIIQDDLKALEELEKTLKDNPPEGLELNVEQTNSFNNGENITAGNHNE